MISSLAFGLEGSRPKCGSKTQLVRLYDLANPKP